MHRSEGSMSDEPRTYRDTTPDRRRHFELFRDRVHLRVKSHAMDGETTIQLANLNPVPERLLVRPQVPLQLALLLIAVASGIVIGAFATGADDVSPAVFIALLVAIVGAVILVFFGKKVEYLRFKTDADAVMLDVARRGPDSAQFEEFTTELQTRIQAARRGDEPSTI
jgi:hypothetical protein